MYGPPRDGIGHACDEFRLWLNPQMNATVYPPNGCQWNMGLPAGTAAFVHAVTVSQLRRPETMPAGLRHDLIDRRGMTQADFDDILALNPWADEALSGPRLRQVDSMFYQPPGFRGGSQDLITRDVHNMTTTTHATETSVSCGVTVTESVGLEGVGKLSASQSFSWTNSTSSVSSSSSESFAKVAISGPSADWQGLTEVAAYRDTVFQSFCFALVEAPKAED